MTKSLPLEKLSAALFVSFLFAYSCSTTCAENNQTIQARVTAFVKRANAFSSKKMLALSEKQFADERSEYLAISKLCQDILYEQSLLEDKIKASAAESFCTRRWNALNAHLKIKITNQRDCV
jgi:hypothetical protein